MTIKEWHRAFKVQLDSLDTQSALRLQPEVVDIFLNKAINKVMMDLYDKYEESQEMSDAISSQTIIVDCVYNKKPNHFANRWKVDLPLDYYHHLQSYAKIGCNVKTEDVYETVRETKTRMVDKQITKTITVEVPLLDANGNQVYQDDGRGGLIPVYTTQEQIVTEIIQVPEEYIETKEVLVGTKLVADKEGYVKTVKHLLDTESKVLGSPFEKPDDTEIPMFFKDGGIYVYLPPNFDLMQFSLTYLKNPKQVSYNGNNGLGIDSDIDEYLHERIINLAVIYALETYSSERTAAKVQIKDVT